MSTDNDASPSDADEKQRTVEIDTHLSYHGDISQHFGEALWPEIKELCDDPESGIKLGERIEIEGQLTLTVEGADDAE